MLKYNVNINKWQNPTLLSTVIFKPNVKSIKIKWWLFKISGNWELYYFIICLCNYFGYKGNHASNKNRANTYI